MNIAGIIVEYNPMHKGHIKHIEETKKLTNCDSIIAIMSGNFVQRGLPSILDKWTKANIALLNGVDLVIELPTIYSLSSAEFFSLGAVGILDKLNIVNSICFGSESGNTKDLDIISKILLDEPLDYKKFLKNSLDEGISYAKARNIALDEFNKKYKFSENSLTSIISSSNNILGIEYMKSLKKLKSNITPYTIERKGSNYNDEDLNLKYSSASSIRKYLKEKDDISLLENHIPLNTFSVLKKLKDSNFDFNLENSMTKFIQYKNISENNKLNNLPDIKEGLENRISKLLLNKNSTFNDLVLSIKSKRYTYTRISRILCQYFIGFENHPTNLWRKEVCNYARILGFNKKGASILKQIKKNSNINLYTKIPKNPAPILNLDIASTKAYSLLNKNISMDEDYLKSPIIIK